MAVGGVAQDPPGRGCVQRGERGNREMRYARSARNDSCCDGGRETKPRERSLIVPAPRQGERSPPTAPYRLTPQDQGPSSLVAACASYAYKSAPIFMSVLIARPLRCHVFVFVAVFFFFLLKVMIASTVSSKMLSAVARLEGFTFEETLPGFKWMGRGGELAQEE